MTKYIYIGMLCFFGYQAKAQTYNYTDLGILFSQEENLGTARSTGLNGAMGATGGDLSSININPAGIAIYNNSEFSFTVGSHNYNNTTDYYNSTQTNQSKSFNVDQLGAVFSLKKDKGSYGWSKVNFALNYQKTNNFHTQDLFFGDSNTNYPSFYIHPNDPDPNNEYFSTISQEFDNYIEGYSSKFNIALAGQYNDYLYLGASLNLNHLEFSQSTELNELNEDNDGYILDGLVKNTLTEQADGASINIGFIIKPTKSLRLGLAYQSPTWYNEIIEDFSTEEVIASIPEKDINATTPYRDSSYYEYELRTASKLTASGAFILGKIGFLNIDYTYKGYSSLQFINNSDFRDTNQYYNDVLQDTHNINMGGEIRFNNISLRGGIGYEQTPFKDINDPREIDVLKLGNKYSGSLGVGMRFGHSNFDIAYRRTVQNNEYDFNDSLQQYEYIQSGTIDNNNSRIVATYNYSF